MWISGFSGFVDVVAEMLGTVDRGVSPCQAFGVSAALAAVGVRRLVSRFLRSRQLSGPGVVTSVSFLPAAAIHSSSLDSKASRYSCFDCISSSPGKKSRAIICDSASVYSSSSSTLAGRFIRFGGGGGGMREVWKERLVRAVDGEGTAMMSGTT